jgi:glycosyltransferase involved in cell wall biosynthesis
VAIPASPQDQRDLIGGRAVGLHPVERWICCQLGAREHYAVARALHRHGALELLLTDAWVRPNDLLGRGKAGLRARFHADLATAEVYAPNASNIAFELRSRLAGLRGWDLIMARNNWFQKVTVKGISRNAVGGTIPVVMAYSYAALDILRSARARGWRTVLAQIDPGPVEEQIVARLHEEDRGLCANWQPAPKEYWASWREECAVADRVVVNSTWSEAALREEGVPAEKLRTIPLAYDARSDAEAFRREYPPAFTHSRPLRVLFLGQINLRKGIGPLLGAIRLLRGEPIEFTLAGNTQAAIPADLRDDARVKWVGSVPREQTKQFYRDADLFVFPTFSDGFGLTQLEAQAWGLPIVTTRFCGKVVEDDRNGWLLPDVTPDAIAKAIRRARENPSRLQEMSARAAPAEAFGLERVGRQWLDVFD